MRTLLALALFLVASLSVGASAYRENKLVQENDADVNVTIMRWGALDDKTDRIVGQVVSKNHESVTLVFEETGATQTMHRVTITTPVQSLGSWRERGYLSSCMSCLRSQRHNTAGSTNSKGAKISGGCHFGFTFPRVTSLRKLRLVNVMVGDKPVSYICKFNVSPDLLRSPMATPVSRTATLHTPVFSIETVKVEPPAPPAQR